MSDDTHGLRDVAEALRAGAALASPKEANGDFVGLPDNYSVHDLERFFETPRRARGEFRAEDAVSVTEYIKQRGNENTRIFASRKNSRIVGVINHHGEQPGFGDFRVIYDPPYSEEWERWTEASGNPCSQVEFARFIEENMVDVVEPSGAEIYEIANSLRANKKMSFVSDQRLSDGSVQFTYNDEIETATTKGKIKVPEHFVIGVPVFFNGPRYRVTCNLRYRIDGGTLKMWFDLHRAEYVEQDAFNEIVKIISDGTGIAPFLGSFN